MAAVFRKKRSARFADNAAGTLDVRQGFETLDISAQVSGVI